MFQTKFFENFDQNRIFFEDLAKIGLFRKIQFFPNFDQTFKVFGTLTEIEIFRNFRKVQTFRKFC